MLAGPVLAGRTSLTGIGIMVGAAVAASLGGTWALHRASPGAPPSRRCWAAC